MWTSLFFLWCGVSPARDATAGPDFEQKRRAMVERQIQARGITDPRVLAAMRKVKRHLFVPERMIPYAYQDSALPIDNNQTISQPYIVALMTELADLKPTDKVLEIGTGSGYQAAILAELTKEVFSIEIIAELADRARERLNKLGYTNIQVIHGDGYRGWPQEAPFDAIIITAAAEEIPERLIEQLKVGGRMVIPLGDFWQDLYLVTKNNDGSINKKQILGVRFVPLVHETETQKK